jgi:two-component system CheB/CheR fusion protein
MQSSESEALKALLDFVRRQRSDLRTQLEASKGELETAYEELQSTNEELQSTYEELETMNEELQSTNDEIRVINDQLGDSAAEISRLNSFLRSIVDGQQIAVIVIDSDLRVTIWNRKARELWGLSQDDVFEQPIFNLDIGLPVRELRDAVRSVLRGAVPNEQRSLPSHDRKGKAFECHVTVAPLTDADGIHGAILTMDAERTAQQEPIRNEA